MKPEARSQKPEEPTMFVRHACGHTGTWYYGPTEKHKEYLRERLQKTNCNDCGGKEVV